jgi:hypothetical protein
MQITKMIPRSFGVGGLYSAGDFVVVVISLAPFY